MNPELHYKPLWLVIGYSMVALIVYLSVASTPPMPDIGFDWQDKLYHLLAYFTVMFWFVQLYHRGRQQLMYAAGFIVMGVGLEYIQSFDPQRYSEWQDMVANSAGVVIAWLLAKTGLRNVLVNIEEKYLSANARK